MLQKLKKAAIDDISNNYFVFNGKVGMHENVASLVSYLQDIKRRHAEQLNMK